ncbi:MAG: hypothetical protein ABWK00_06435 [Desulfurococcaceae archaeon]
MRAWIPAILTVLALLTAASAQAPQASYLEALLSFSSSDVGYFNGSDAYLWGRTFSVVGTLINWYEGGVNASLTLVVNGFSVGSYSWTILPRGTVDVDVSWEIPADLLSGNDTYSLLLWATGLDGHSFGGCPLASGRLYVSGISWDRPFWSVNVTPDGVSVGVGPSIVTNGSMNYVIYLYASGLAPLHMYDIYVAYSTAPSLLVPVNRVGAGYGGDIYLPITIRPSNVDGYVKVVVVDPSTNRSYESSVSWRLVSPPPRTCPLGQITSTPPTYTPRANPTTTSAASTTTAQRTSTASSKASTTSTTSTSPSPPTSPTTSATTVPPLRSSSSSPPITATTFTTTLVKTITVSKNFSTTSIVTSVYTSTATMVLVQPPLTSAATSIDTWGGVERFRGLQQATFSFLPIIASLTLIVFLLTRRTLGKILGFGRRS